VGPGGEIAGAGLLLVIFARVLLAEGGRCVGIAALTGRDWVLFWKLTKAQRQILLWDVVLCVDAADKRACLDANWKLVDVV